jgi:hypothetical protein
MTETITTILTEDGATIAIGETAYDYYGMGVVTLSWIDQQGQTWCCNCPVHTSMERDNYWGMWAPVEGRGGQHPWGGMRDGSRVVSLAWATRKGWPGTTG